MATKVYADGNYLIIEGDGIYIDAPSSDIEVKYNSTYQEYNIYDKQAPGTILYTAKIPGVQKQDETDYTDQEFRTFYRGLSSGGGGGGTTTVNAPPSFFALDRPHFTDTISEGGTAQILVTANSSRKGLEFQNQSDDILTLGIGSSPSSTNGFTIPSGGGYATDNKLSTKEIRIWGATTGQRFTFVEY